MGFVSSGVGSDDRYSRQEILPGLGRDGQARLGRSHAVIVGCGALGCGILDQLSRAGIGRLTIIDRDVIEWSNLQRQVLFAEEDARQGRPKALAGADRARAINSEIRVHAEIKDLTPENAESLLLGTGKPDILLDGTDNLETRYLLNDVAVKHSIPLVYGGVIARRGMQMTIRPHPLPHAGPCLRCVFPEPSATGETETCDTAGVLGAAVGIVSSLQASAATDVLLGRNLERPAWLTEFALDMGRFRSLDVSKFASPELRKTCTCCGQRRFEFLSGERARPAVTLCGRGAFQIPAGQSRIDLSRLASNVSRVSPVTATEYFVRIKPRDGVEMTVFADARAVVRGVATDGEARALYDRFVGA